MMNRSKLFKQLLCLCCTLALLLTAAGCGAPQAELPTAYHTNAHGYPSYSVFYTTDEAGEITYSYLDQDGAAVTLTPEEVEAMQDVVVAACGDDELTNLEMILFYQQSLYDFYNAYGNYVSYMMDTTKALDEQLSLSEDGTTWQEDMITGAFATYHRLYSMYEQAVAAGYTMPEDLQADLDQVSVDMDAMAAEQGMESGDEYMAFVFGPGVTVADYVEFLRVNYLAGSYASMLVEQEEVTPEQLEAFYDENPDYFSSYGVTKTDKQNVNVRHILISVEDTENEAAWAEAEATANALLSQWQQGEATEETFAELANEHSTDPGSNTNGGLYEDVYPGQMVTAFNDWCFDESRQVGDTGVVKTDYGYHIMYFSGESDSIYWQEFAEEAYLSDRMSALYSEAAAACEMTTYPEKVMILDGSVAPSIPETETETETETDAQ